MLPDALSEAEEGRQYEAVEVGGDIPLLVSPLDRKRLAHIEKLGRLSIEEHRKTLEGLAR